MRILATSRALSPVELDALVAIGRGCCHALSIADDIQERGGPRHVTQSAIYAALTRLLRLGLIAELRECRVGEVNGRSRVRCYVVSDAGREVASAEVRRLRALLDDCRAVGF